MICQPQVGAEKGAVKSKLPGLPKYAGQAVHGKEWCSGCNGIGIFGGGRVAWLLPGEFLEKGGILESWY